MEPQAQVPPLPQQAAPGPPRPESPLPGQPVEEPAAAGQTKSARRRRKALLLPQIAQLALEGQSGTAIALKFGLPTRTVNHWLREMRSQWLAAATHSGAELAAVALARLDGIYCAAMEAWHQAQAETQPPATARRQAAGGDRAASGKGPRRRPRPHRDALLGRAISAVRESFRLLGQSAGAAAAPPPPPQQRHSTDDLQHMTDEELLALEASLKAQRELAGNDRNCPDHAEQGQNTPP